MRQRCSQLVPLAVALRVPMHCSHRSTLGPTHLTLFACLGSFSPPFGKLPTTSPQPNRLRRSLVRPADAVELKSVSCDYPPSDDDLNFNSRQLIPNAFERIGS